MSGTHTSGPSTHGRYDPQRVERTWQDRWSASGVLNSAGGSSQDGQHEFVVDMFPYPSGNGLHVGHPLGYVATDVYARFRRAQGVDVIHAMAFDSFGLPAEQHAIASGRHPAEITAENVSTFIQQLSILGLGHDPSRRFCTSDVEFYRHTQELFLAIYHAWYDPDADAARPISTLVEQFRAGQRPFGYGGAWDDLAISEQEAVLSGWRLAYRAEAEVNWCPGLGTVLADSEVTEEGRSERGDYPVHRKRLTQWFMRITAYKDRLISDLAPLDWPASVKVAQRNWITGKAGRGGPMRDWLYSRQRYWGEPFPIVYDEEGTPFAVPAEHLPVQLPAMDSYAPDTTDSSDPVPPLSRASDWVEVTVDFGDGPRRVRREVNTMPQWAGSCWYYLRYLSPRLTDRFVDAEAERHWMAPTAAKPVGGVDLYVGGAEHATLHLLYARFWHKVLFDLGMVSSPEPFHRLVNQGYVQAWAYRDARGMYVDADEVVERDGHFYYGEVEVTRSYGKMGKSLRNVVTPEEVCSSYGADAFRWSLMAAAPLDTSRPWDDKAPAAGLRQVERLWRVVIDPDTGHARHRPSTSSPQARQTVDTAVIVVTEAYEKLALNLAVARIIELINAVTRTPDAFGQDAVRDIVRLAAPLIPHVCEELWRRLNPEAADTVTQAGWPQGRPPAPSQITYPVQVNGKVRGRITVPADTDADAVVAVALADEDIARYVNGVPRNVRVVPGRIVVIVC